ncbi:MAG: glycosyltransferase [Bacteroidia bacterium]
MKVVHLSTSDRGGAGMAAVRLHLALLSEGVDSHLLTLYKFTNDIPEHTRYNPSSGKNFPVFSTLLEKARKALKYSGIVSPKFQRMAKRHLKNRPRGFENFSFAVSPYHLQNHPLIKEADIVHLHWVSEGFLDYTSFFSEIKNKIVWTLHDMNPFTGGCHHADDCEKFKRDCLPCPQLKNTIDDTFAGKILEEKKVSLNKISDRQLQVVTPSAWLGKLSKQSKLFQRFAHHTIPNPIDSSIVPAFDKAEARKQLGLPQDKKIVLFISHHIDNSRKGLQKLLEALQYVDRTDILVCSAGHELISGQEWGIHHLGYIENEEEMAEIYSAADLFVLPSQAENLPNTICESLFCGTPVVAFSVGGIPELIDSTNGKMAEAGDVRGLALAIHDVLDHPEKYSREQIRIQAIEKMGNAKVANAYRRIYNVSIEQGK